MDFEFLRQKYVNIIDKMKKFFTIKKMLFFSIFVRSIIVCFYNTSQLYHFRNTPLSFFQSEFARQLHYFNIDSISLTIFSTILSFCVNFFLILFLERAWKWTKNNFTFYLLYQLISILFVSLPERLIQDFIISPKYGVTVKFSESISKLLSNSVPLLILSIIELLFFLFLAKITSLPQYPYEEAPSEQNTTVISNTPNPLDIIDEPEIPNQASSEITTQSDNLQPQQNVRFEHRGCKGCLKGKFWLTLFIIITSLITIINNYSPNIYMTAMGTFSPLTEENLVPVIKNLTDYAGLQFSSVFVQEEGSPNAMLIGLFSKKLIIVRSIIPLVLPIELGAIEHMKLDIGNMVIFLFSL